MAKKKNPIVFMDVSIGDEPDERMVFEVLCGSASLLPRCQG
jgi:peptidyl-prolyl isomerase G (cyclophilin G)